MQKTEKEHVVAELTEKLRTTDTLIVADYRGLTNKQLEKLRETLTGHGARFVVVKNTLTRRAAEAAGVEALLALLEGPTAIAFIEAEGDPAAVAKALSDAASETKVLVLRGGVLEGRGLSGAEIEELAKLPPLDVLKGQVVGAILAPLNGLAGLLNAPLQDLVGLIDARIEQLGGASADSDATGEGASADAEVADDGGASADAEAPGTGDEADTAAAGDEEGDTTLRASAEAEARDEEE